MSKKAMSKRARVLQAIGISMDPNKPLRQQAGGVKPKKAGISMEGPYRTSSYDIDPCKSCNCFNCGSRAKDAKGNFVVCVECPQGNHRIKGRPVGCTGCPKRVERVYEAPHARTNLGDLIMAALSKK